jgi:eukaryotic-like serine/threonine-protein kinase
MSRKTRSDGRELFYVSLDRKLMAVDIQTTPSFRAGVPRALFRLAAPTGFVRNSYAPSRSGDRFLVNSYAEDAASTIVLLLNWPVALSE